MFVTHGHGPERPPTSWGDSGVRLAVAGLSSLQEQRTVYDCQFQFEMETDLQSRLALEVVEGIEGGDYQAELLGQGKIGGVRLTLVHT